VIQISSKTHDTKHDSSSNDAKNSTQNSPGLQKCFLFSQNSQKFNEINSEKEFSFILPGSNQSSPKQKITTSQISFPFTLFSYTCETIKREPIMNDSRRKVKRMREEKNGEEGGERREEKGTVLLEEKKRR